MGVSISLYMLIKEIPFHTSPRVDQCPILGPSTCTMGLDPCDATQLLGAWILTAPTFSTHPATLCALPQHLPFPFSVIVPSSQYLFQRGPISIIQYH